MWSEQGAEEAGVVRGTCSSVDADANHAPAAECNNESHTRSGVSSEAGTEGKAHARSQNVADISSKHGYIKALQQSPGYKVARALHAEILKTGRYNHDAT